MTRVPLMPYLLRGALLAMLALLVCAQPVSAQQPRRAARAAPPPVPAPSSVLGFEPGTDRKLPSWKQIVDYFEALDRASPRITVRTLGRTTLGRPFIAAIIADSAVLASLPRYREIQRKLADPRLRTRPGERERLIAEGKTVVLVTSSIHSTEVGAILTPLVLAHRLVSDTTADARAIRSEAITLLVPSLNPDGIDIVGDWYRSTLDTPAEGTPPAELYHHYVGHDNNRDWYAFTQVETQLTIDSLHNVWHPQIVNDIHQQQSNAARIFIPPFMDPIEPNVDPIVTAGVNQLGMSMIWRLTADGKRGIATNASYDAWTPARAYQHYHGGVRILTETASARLATPIDIPFDSLRESRGYDARTSTWNFLAPWEGGRWTLADIIDYQTSATWAMLAEAARDRRSWLEAFARIHERALLGNRAPGRESWPVAFAIPPHQRNQAEMATVLRILQRGMVEIQRASEPFEAAGEKLPRGTYLIHTAQPYGAFAKALLERQRYPDLREYPGGPPKRPYDVTAHTLPLLAGIEVVAIQDSVRVPMTMAAPISRPPLSVLALSERSERKIALYRSHAPSMDEGWTRWVLDQYQIPYRSVVDRDLRQADLSKQFDVIILPDQSPSTLARGPSYSGYPDSLRGGIGDEGAAALKRFVEDGGTLIAFNEASRYAIEVLELPVRNVLDGVGAAEFYGPGSLLAVEVNGDHPVARLYDAPVPAVWFEDSPAFEITDAGRATAVLTYPSQGDPLLSGWLLGGEMLHGRAALVDVELGKGHVILFGFRPQYRAQSMATYPLIWGAMLR